MQEIIKKAIEGGYKTFLSPVDVDFPRCKTLRESMCMDKDFWVSLGKACGWGIDRESYMQFIPQWRDYAIRFHEINLTEGWDAAVSWLNDLIK